MEFDASRSLVRLTDFYKKPPTLRFEVGGFEISKLKTSIGTHADQDVHIDIVHIIKALVVTMELILI